MTRPTSPGHLVSGSLIALALILIGVGLLPVPFVKMSPGPVHDVLGSTGVGQFIEISGTTTYPTTGQLDMLTVTERGGPAGALTLPEAYWGWIDPDQQLVPRDLIYPPDRSDDESEQISRAQFSGAESDAIAAALGLIGQPVQSTVIVRGVVDDGPAAGKVQPDDVILRVNSVPVTKASQVVDLVRGNPPGTTVGLEIERDGNRSGVDVTLGPDPEDPGRGRAGILLANQYRADFPIEFGAGDVGGPSAGLVLALGLVDKLTPGSLTGGSIVAATGTIDPEGHVGSIGGVREKAVAARQAGARVMLVPEDNCAQLGDVDPGGMAVIPVRDLRGSVDVLRRWSDGGELPQRCR